ncbi:CBS domain-containing protein [Marispirochaeta sp.]|uniref:CBS domain-containing protein n=1 Tax=Marispirochaeta sp. TaxID=2038653 RepID=UPI0029C97D41|nr:CBS domain-containing protein [Marispirochaeta sp.]
MMIRNLINRNEDIVHPFTSTESVEKILLEKYYVVVMDNGEFKGIVTQPDIIKTGHNLIIDCIIPKSRLSVNDDLPKAIQTMQKEQQFTLPVFDETDTYIGSLSYTRIMENIYESGQGSIRDICSPMSNVEVKINNVIGPEDFESVKQMFISELSHYTKNSIQVIYSSIELYKTANENQEKEELLSSIYDNTRKIDGILNQLFHQYFSGVN